MTLTAFLKREEARLDRIDGYVKTKGKLGPKFAADYDAEFPFARKALKMLRVAVEALRGGCCDVIEKNGLCPSDCEEALAALDEIAEEK